MWDHDAHVIPTITMFARLLYGARTVCTIIWALYGHHRSPVIPSSVWALCGLFTSTVQCTTWSSKNFSQAIYGIWDMWPRRLRLPWDCTMSKKQKIVWFHRWQNYLTTIIAFITEELLTFHISHHSASGLTMFTSNVYINKNQKKHRDFDPEVILSKVGILMSMSEIETALNNIRLIHSFYQDRRTRL